MKVWKVNIDVFVTGEDEQNAFIEPCRPMHTQSIGDPTRPSLAEFGRYPRHHRPPLRNHKLRRPSDEISNTNLPCLLRI